MPLKTRRPTGAVPWPLILIEGGEKAGKSWSCAEFSASDRIGQMYWIDLGEGSADEYGAIPGADYLVVEHDGSFASLYAAVEEVRAIAGQAAAKGEKPVVLTIDAMTAEWDLLKDWAHNRAKGSKSNRKKLAEDPNAEISVSTNYWNDANARHGKLMRLLMTFPGIVLITARGKEVAVIGDNGQPVEGKKTYRVEGHKNLAFDATCWVRVSRDGPGVVIGARSVHAGIRPGRDEPRTLPGEWNLEWLVFEVLKCDPAKAHARDLVEAKPERTPEQIRDEVFDPATNSARLRELYRGEAKSMLGVLVPNEHDKEEALGALIGRLGQAKAAAEPATEQQLAHLAALWGDADMPDQDARLKFTGEILGREVVESDVLTGGEADQVIKRLQAYITQDSQPAKEQGVAA
ncbi:hypothetical protein Sme01_04130 [Sphaerisporangium melleum]|uniref:Uncharacterized protein n=1 Tax=Sphaerisporangium melleum TaxID=321316 RepID=A0A917VCB6_9ACTN|nr:hypothetical protein [Sphaerisporangium melleum]GGK62175.1 hypothetical protein GCM10007964_01680 [Sphaerisporangium melleum]GII67937.1 hypothetical protein Sme01_04130 [Sphaerisporangium melleum]